MTGPFGSGPVRVASGVGLRAAAPWRTGSPSAGGPPPDTTLQDTTSQDTTPPDTTPQQDMDLSAAALAALGDAGAVARLRVHRPRPTAAFSRVDSLAPGFPAAQEAARAHGFAPVVRPAGGR